jgi:hypothetical protein
VIDRFHRGTYCHYLENGQQILLICWYIHTRLHCVTSPKTVVLIVNWFVSQMLSTKAPTIVPVTLCVGGDVLVCRVETMALVNHCCTSECSRSVVACHDCCFSQVMLRCGWGGGGDQTSAAL